MNVYALSMHVVHSLWIVWTLLTLLTLNLHKIIIYIVLRLLTYVFHVKRDKAMHEYLFSFVPENIQPKMIPNIRYFAPTWCALFFIFHSVWHTPDCFEIWGRVQQKVAHSSFHSRYFFSLILSLLLFFNLHLKWQVIACDVFCCMYKILDSFHRSSMIFQLISIILLLVINYS